VQDGYKIVRTESGSEVTANALLLAVGSTYRRLDVPGEDDFIGAGVHFCATCDGPFYKGREVMVVGGGNSAGEESLFLTKFSPRVTVVTRGAELSASAIVKQKVAETPGITVVPNSTIAAFSGAGSRLETVTLRNLQTGELTEAAPAGVFVFIGQQPNTPFVKGLVELDERGFILTGKGLETSVPGIFAAGDAREGSTKQAASAVGEGATAALAIREYLHNR
jgi:thioredoxin reductase (NADPH)